MTLNPAFLRAASKQEQQATDESPVGSLNVANLNTKTGDSNESQTIAVNYNLLRNDDIVRWNGTDVKLRSPTGLTTINRVKFRSFVGDLLPYTSLSLPSLKCDIVAYVSPQYDPSLATSNETTGYVIGSESGNFDPYEIDVSNRKTTVIQSYTKPWTYNADTEDSQIEYNIEEMLRYVNASFSSFLSDMSQSFQFLQQSNLEILSDFDVLQFLDDSSNMTIKKTDLIWSDYFTTSSLVFGAITGTAYNIAPVRCLDSLHLKLTECETRAWQYLVKGVYNTIVLLNTSYADGFETGDNDRVYANISSGVRQLRMSLSTYTTPLYDYYAYTCPTFSLWSDYGFACCPNGFGMTSVNIETAPLNASFLFQYYPRTSSEKATYATLKLSELFGNSTGKSKYTNGKAVDCQCVGYTIVTSGSGYSVKLAVAVLGYDSNSQLRVVYDFATVVINNGTAVASSSGTFATNSFDDGMLFEDYQQLHLERRDKFNFDYANRTYEYSTLESNVYYEAWFDRYFFKVNKSSGLVDFQPVPILIERIYIGTNYYYLGPSTNLTVSSVKHYRVAYTSTHMSSSDYYSDIVNNACFRKASDLEMPLLSFEDYDRVMTIPSNYTGSSSITVSLLLCRNFYEACGTLVTDGVMRTDLSFARTFYTSAALKTQLSTNGTKQTPINTIQLSSDVSLPSISLYDSTYFSYSDGVMRYPYISYTNGYVVSLVPVFYTEPYYFKTSISLPSVVSSLYTLDTYEYTPEIKTLNDTALQLLETLLLLQYEYNDLQLRCSNFPNNDNVVFSVNEICRIAFKIMQTNANSFELVINVCDSSGGAIELETLKRLYGKLQLSVDFEK